MSFFANLFFLHILTVEFICSYPIMHTKRKQKTKAEKAKVKIANKASRFVVARKLRKQEELEAQRKIPVWKKKMRAFWGILGPGLITGASDDDPSGIATYMQAWARFGLQTLRTAILTLPLMTAVQEMSGRIWLVTKKWIVGALKAYYPKYIVYIVAALVVPACILNIGADLSAMGAVSQLIVPGVHEDLWIFFYALIIIYSMIRFPFKKFESVMKWLALTLAVYFIIPFLVQQDRLAIFEAAFTPHIQLNKEFIAILVAILGTTISPYLFVREASMELEWLTLEQKEKIKKRHRLPSLKNRVRLMKKWNATGMIFSSLAMFFIMLTAWTILFNWGIHNIQTVQDAANALRPIAWDWSYALFATGIMGTWFLTIPVLAGVCSYIISETIGRKGWISTSRSEWKSFYIVIIASVLVGAVMNLLHIDPIQSLIWSAIWYGLIAPVMIAIILHMCNNKKVMWDFTNKRITNIFWGIAFLLMAVAAIALLYTSF